MVMAHKWWPLSTSLANRIPTEIFERILDHLYDDVRTLNSLYPCLLALVHQKPISPVCARSTGFPKDRRVFVMP
ncbi:hypothetical protein K443DRAFT_683658 [Laccaria amethystina LaAM-08-1]|uniref:Uncharacterized protein n=1 Tax=Laccaria amethystina LaAM-08-1 TaxID=1095629 RepID=A0A0C9WJE2_9AGAR|nr:hypothetical protein K443DRAFT_683658 [Laccaria amethystina LaAM-08-1]